jgi:hypothetical protein
MDKLRNTKIYAGKHPYCTVFVSMTDLLISPNPFLHLSFTLLGQISSPYSMQEVFRTSANRSFAIICVAMNGLEWKFAPISSPATALVLPPARPIGQAMTLNLPGPAH